MAEISVLIPVYNGEGFLPRALAMLDAQTFQDFELVLIDDGSTDNTFIIAKQHAADRTGVVVIQFHENRGVAAARNAALEVATGRYVWFADCDDRWSPDLLAKLHTAIVEADADIAVCRQLLVGPTPRHGRVFDRLAAGAVLDGDATLRELIEVRMTGSLCNKLIRREMFGTKPFQPFWTQEDLDFILTVTERVRRVAVVADILYTYVARHGSRTRQRCRDLDGPRRCWVHGREQAIARGLYDPGARGLAIWDYRYFAYVVSTYHTIGVDSPSVHTQLAEVRRAATVSGALRVLPTLPVEASVVMLYRLLGYRYGTAHRLLWKLGTRLPRRARPRASMGT